MSRVIKFRVWDNQQSLFWEEPSFRQVSLRIDGLPHFWSGDDIYFAGKLWPDMWTLEQFTGLLDKNGKEIYEGDVVKTSPSPGCISSLLAPEDFTSYTHGIVEWFHGSWNVCQPHLGSVRLYDFTDCECCRAYSVEVIGNIHENPDPLK